MGERKWEGRPGERRARGGGGGRDVDDVDGDNGGCSCP